MDLRWPRVYRRSNVGLVYNCVDFCAAWMALLILVGRRSVSHSSTRYDLVTWQSIKEWHKLGLGGCSAFWVVETEGGAITSTWLVVSGQKSIDALNSDGQLLLDKDIAIKIALFIAILQNKKGIKYNTYNNGPNGHLFYVGGDLMMRRGVLPIHGGWTNRRTWEMCRINREESPKQWKNVTAN